MTVLEHVRTRATHAVSSSRVRNYVSIWTIVLVMSGQGFRHLLGLPLYGVLSALTVIAVAVCYAASGQRFRVPFLIVAFVGLAALSVTWSATRGVSAIAVGLLIATTFIAVATVRGSGTVAFMSLLYRGLQISLYAGILFEVFVAFAFRGPVPPLSSDLAEIAGVDDQEGVNTWSENLLLEGGPIQGFVGNRNPFGALALLAGVVALVLLLDKRIGRLDGIATLSAAAGVHLLTQSATVTVAALYIVFLLLAALAIRRVSEPMKRVLSFSTLTLTAVAGVLTLKYRNTIFEALDREPDATHRTEIWGEVVRVAEQRPEGWGFVGYWPVWERPYSTIIDNVGLLASHAHNAFLDAWFQVGLVGAVLLIVIVTLLFGSAWRLVERASRGDTFIPLGWALLTAALVLQALTESRLLVEGGWFLLVALYCSGPQVFTLTMVDPERVHSADPLEPDADPHEPAIPLTAD